VNKKPDERNFQEELTATVLKKKCSGKHLDLSYELRAGKVVFIHPEVYLTVLATQDCSFQVLLDTKSEIAVR
jgi:hypothetical protein